MQTPGMACGVGIFDGEEGEATDGHDAVNDKRRRAEFPPRISNRAMALSRTDRHGEALGDCLAALKLAKQRCPHADHTRNVAKVLETSRTSRSTTAPTSRGRRSGLAMVAVLSGQGLRTEAVDALRPVSDQLEQLLARLTRRDARLPIVNL
jgi:hypothetical protein